VRDGDSLALISQRFNVSVSKLKKWNPQATKGKYIQPGQQLVV
jgi:membrane-bound lytic murein transglycosylase D